MNERYFKFAAIAARKADYKNRAASKIGAVAIYKGSIIAEAWNTEKTSTLQNKYNIYRYTNKSMPPKAHCETNLIQKIRWKCGNSLDWNKVEIYLYREYQNGELALCRPCCSCINLLKDYGIKSIYYTTPDGFVEERFK